jgi:hypothetical protein
MSGDDDNDGWSDRGRDRCCYGVACVWALLLAVGSAACFGVLWRLRDDNGRYGEMACTVVATWVDGYACQVACGVRYCVGQRVCTAYCDGTCYRGRVRARYDVAGTEYELERTVLDGASNRADAQARLASAWAVNATFAWDYRIADPRDYGDYRYPSATLDQLVGLGLGLAAASLVIFVAIVTVACCQRRRRRQRDAMVAAIELVVVDVHPDIARIASQQPGAKG